MNNAFRNCGHCHTCGTELYSTLDGEEWCPFCLEYKRYVSHGWSRSVADYDSDECPSIFFEGDVDDVYV